MDTALISVAGAIVASVVAFAIARYFAARDLETQRLRELELRIESFKNLNDRLAVIETAVETTALRVNELHHCYDQLVSQLHDSGLKVERQWFRW